MAHQQIIGPRLPLRKYSRHIYIRSQRLTHRETVMSYSQERPDRKRAAAMAISALLLVGDNWPACGAPGDTNIYVTYKVASIRVRPAPIEGDGSGNLRVVLHADGKVDDVVEGEGRYSRRWEMKDRKLGPQESGAQYRVIDRNTIVRTSSGPTHIFTVRITVSGKSCRADVAYTLKPGHKEFQVYSPQLGTAAFYSKLAPHSVSCRIE